jgi:hypothetical protein
MFWFMVEVGRPCLTGLAVALLAVVAAPTTAGADSPMGGRAAVRLVDMSSDAQTADFYLDGARAWSGVSYKTVSSYIEIAAGNHLYEVRKAGSAAGSRPLATVQEVLKPGGFYSVMTAGPLEGLRATVFDDGSSSMPTADVCQARFINATPDLTIDVTVRGLDTNFSSLAFMQASPYGQLPKASMTSRSGIGPARRSSPSSGTTSRRAATCTAWPRRPDRAGPSSLSSSTMR